MLNILSKEDHTKMCTLIVSILNKSYGQMIDCFYCNNTSNKILTHDHFLTCKMVSERNEYWLKSILDTMLQLQTPLYVREGITNGKDWYYNSKGKEEQFYRVLKTQEYVRWENFGRGRISITIKDEMDEWYEGEN